jgi:hypothetical protein
MRKSVIVIIVGLWALTWLTVGVASAKGKTTAERITITGPGMNTTIVVTDIVTLQKLSLMSFEDFEQPIEPPEDIGPGYTIIRYFRDGEYVEEVEHPNALFDPAEEIMFQREQGFRPMDKIRYHPDPTGGSGYIFYIQLNLNIIVSYEGNWYRATEMGDETIRGVLAENDVSLPVENGVVHSSTASDENRELAMLIVAIPGGLLFLIGLLWRKRRQIIIESG